MVRSIVSGATHPSVMALFTPKYVDLRALSSIVASRIYALFVVKSTSVPKLGGGGVKPILAMPRFWERLLFQHLPNIHE